MKHLWAILHIQLESLKMDNGRSVGCERLALEARESLRFSEAHKDVGMSDRDARITMHGLQWRW